LRGDRTHRSHKCANRQKNQRYRSHLHPPEVRARVPRQ
jgi:hypothetical protein